MRQDENKYIMKKETKCKKNIMKETKCKIRKWRTLYFSQNNNNNSNFICVSCCKLVKLFYWF